MIYSVRVASDSIEVLIDGGSTATQQQAAIDALLGIARLTSCSADYLSYVHAALIFAKPIEE